VRLDGRHSPIRASRCRRRAYERIWDGGIVESRHPEFKKDDKVVGRTGLQEYMVIGSGELGDLQKVPSKWPVRPWMPRVSTKLAPEREGLGLLEIAKPQAGETLIVSAAAGATGSIAGQLGKMHGGYVVGRAALRSAAGL
jgi:NADPH-dependent curcumin reductase